MKAPTESTSEEAVPEEEVGGLLELLDNLDLSDPNRAEGVHVHIWHHNNLGSLVTGTEDKEEEPEEEGENI